MELSPQQDAAAQAVQRWFKSRAAPVFRLFGYAGTGKTTLARRLAEDLTSSVRYGAFTGKAALMLRKRGCQEASTIHSLIYRPVQQPDGGVRYELNRNGPLRDASLIVVDECSMVDEELATDLLSFRVPILVLGDPAQLPPVNGTGYFTDAEPDVMLTEIHRQVRDNPIIRMSMDVREGKRLSIGHYGESRILRRSDLCEADVMGADQVLVGRNATRTNVNAEMRRMLGLPPNMPAENDRLVCLKNKSDRGLLNGGIWTVKSAEPGAGFVRMSVTSEDDGARAVIKVPPEFFRGAEATLSWPFRRRMDEFTFGYALTVHKAQGSQWDDVLIFDEASFFREHSRHHLYTAITRAAKRVTIVQ